MKRILLLIAGALCCALSVPAHAFPLCVSLIDTYSLALADTQGRGPEKWKALLEDGDCAEVQGASYVLTIDTYTADGEVSRIVQYTLAGRMLYGLHAGELPSRVIEVRDNGEWDNIANDAHVREWFRHLMQPDYPSTSCCGEADAYYADSFESGPNGYIAIITDERVIPGRPQLPVGTKVPIPNHKLKYDQGNPTGHGVVFIGSGGQVFCYVAPGGI